MSNEALIDRLMNEHGKHFDAVGDLLFAAAQALRGQNESVGWEYGARHSQGTNVGRSREDAESMVEDFARRDDRLRPEARGKAKLMRRRKAGEWEPVEIDD